jgi:hypothetical protein
MVLDTIWLSELAEKPRRANSVPAANIHSNLGESNQNIQEKEGKKKKQKNERL